jgi:eukaryotic-like serine/threonine-protein kinase
MSPDELVAAGPVFRSRRSGVQPSASRRTFAEVGANMTDASQARSNLVTDSAPSRDHRAIIGRDPAVATPEVSVRDQTAYASTRVGRTLNDRWRLDSLLGVGGMASVYAATHRNGNRVAIKILHPELSGYEELKERFLEEGYAANNVAHPGVVAVYDDGTSEDGCVYLVMELLDGETLQARWQRMPFAFSPRDILALGDQILEILEAAHSKGIVHRDIKPDNIFRTRDGRIKLLDFGIAHNEHSRRTQRTRAGSAMGTPAFMPPEQALGHADRIDGRTDLWALGATLFWLVSGRFVRTEGTANEELLQAMTQPAPALRTVAPYAPADMAHVIDGALAFEKHDRFPDASAMRVAVWQAYAALYSYPDPALVPLDSSVEESAVLLSDDEPSAAASSSQSTTTYRPVTRSNAPPPIAGAPGSTVRSRKRLPIALAVGVTLAAASTVLLVPIPGLGTARLDKASLSILDAALAAGTHSLAASDTELPKAGTTRSAPPAAASSERLTETHQLGQKQPAAVGPRPRAIQKTQRRQAQERAQPSKAASVESASRRTSVRSYATAAESQDPSLPRDPLSRRK